MQIYQEISSKRNPLKKLKNHSYRNILSQFPQLIEIQSYQRYATIHTGKFSIKLIKKTHTLTPPSTPSNIFGLLKLINNTDQKI